MLFKQVTFKRIFFKLCHENKYYEQIMSKQILLKPFKQMFLNKYVTVTIRHKTKQKKLNKTANFGV